MISICPDALEIFYCQPSSQISGQTQTPVTEQEKTYKDSLLGFEFRYQSDWQLNQGGKLNSELTPYSIRLASPETEAANQKVIDQVGVCEGCTDTVEILVRSIGDTSLNDHIKAIKSSSNTQIGTITVGTEQGIIMNEFAIEQINIVFVKHGEYLYEITFAASSNPGLTQVDKNFLKTFSFN